MPKIAVRQGSNAGAEIVLDGEKFTLGRRKACAIPVNDVKSSRNHAEIFKQGTRYYLRDLASRNGTFLNGERLAGDVELSFGDKIAIGETVMEFVEESAGKPIDFSIPGYQVQERIGEGGMGVVYRARQVSMDRVVALKVLSEKYSNNAEFIDRFIREARSAGKLNHPNVIHVHDVSKADGRYFFSMEFVDGPTVKKFLKDKGRLPVAKSLEIITQAAKALEFAHENGIIHRDIKPDNLMLTSEGIVKIADLGIAKSFEEGQDPVAGPGKRKVLGTPHYMAPEQAMGKALDLRADVYSLGATFYHMLTGKTPFKGSTVTELLKAHIHEQLEPIQSLNTEVPEAVCFVVERMMAKLPEKRYENMTRLLEDLDRVGRDAQAPGIERLAPEDSTIMRAVEAGQAAARRRAEKGAGGPPPARHSSALGLILILVAVVLVLAAGICTFFIVKNLRQRQPGGEGPVSTTGSTGSTGTAGPTQPADPPQKKMIDDARNLYTQGKEDAALALAAEVISKYKDTPEAAEAQKLTEEIKGRQQRVLQADINALVAVAERVVREKPEDLGAQLSAWDEVAKKYPGTDAAKRAEAEVAKIRERRSAAETAVRGEKFAAAEKGFDAARRARDFVAAAGIMTRFAADFPDSDEGKRAAERAKEVEAEAAKLFENAAKDSEAAAAAGRFPEAVKILKDLEASVKSAKWLEEIPKKVEAVGAKAKEEYAKAVAPVMEAAKAGNLAEAGRAARYLAGRFKGTAHEADATELAAAIESQPALAKKVIAAINKAGARELTFKMEATLLPGKWTVQSADEDRVYLFSKHPEGDRESPLPWSRLSAKDAYGIYTMYLDKPTAEDHRALAFFCTVKGLAAEAENHRKLSGGK